jgi:glycosyltransferase involved in cell wall biosynthesis
VGNDVPRRVAFTYIAPDRWAGGYNYQRNLFAALDHYCQGAISPILFSGTREDSHDIAALAGIPGVEVVRSPAFDRRRAGLLNAVAVGLDRAAVAEFRAADIDVVFEAARFFGWRLPLPAIAWFPDFQHRRLPQLFSRPSRWRRELGFRAQIASGRSILLSSNSALRDLREFYPNLANDVSVVRFASEPAASFFVTDPFDVLAQHGLPTKFFYVPNQFWRHKNHQILLDALELLKQRGLDVYVVASGSTEEPREPGQFERFMRQVQTRGLETNFLHLGMIPLEHVYALMRIAVALINPSRFEGWSTTVEEAKSFGVPMILSNIDVHLEQTNAEARYFGVDDAAAMADHLAHVWIETEPAIVRELLPNVKEEVRSFAEGFVRLVQNARERYRVRNSTA